MEMYPVKGEWIETLIFLVFVKRTGKWACFSKKSSYKYVKVLYLLLRI